MVREYYDPWHCVKPYPMQGNYTIDMLDASLRELDITELIHAYVAKARYLEWTPDEIRPLTNYILQSIYNHTQVRFSLINVDNVKKQACRDGYMWQIRLLLFDEKRYYESMMYAMLFTSKGKIQIATVGPASSRRFIKGVVELPSVGMQDLKCQPQQYFNSLQRMEDSHQRAAGTRGSGS